MTAIVTYVEVDTEAFGITSPMGPPVTWRFAEPTEYLDRTIDCIPSVASIRYDAGTVSLGENLGQRAGVTVTFRDHRHVMNGEPFGQGTFWGKWRARYGQKLRGRDIRVIRGVVGQSIEQMETRHFFVDTVDGPTPDGIYTITARDLLKFADGDRALAPRLSNGRLAGSIADSDVAATLTPVGIGNLEYPASGHICLGGKEVVAYTRTGDTLALTRAQMGTAPQSHDAGDRAQLVLWYDGDSPADIISDLLQTYGDVPPECIPIADWQAETAAHLGDVLYARAITEPTAVNKLVSDLIADAALAVWYDELARAIRLQVLREIATDAVLYDEETILTGTLKVREQADKRISTCWTYFGQRNPADRGDNEDNYRGALVTAGADAGYDTPVYSNHIGKWLPTLSAAERHNDIKLSRFLNPPRKFNFDLSQGEAIQPGGGYRLRWRQNQNMDGSIVAEGAPIQVTRVAAEPGVLHVEAEEMLASGVVVVTNVVFLTAVGAGTWPVPASWNDAINEIHCIGGGGRGREGGQTNGGRGGGGGAYSGIANLALSASPMPSVQYSIGVGGSAIGVDGGDTWFNGASLGASSVGAKGGTGGTSATGGGIGGAADAGVGTLKTSGGNGGNGSSGEQHTGGGGGGGAGGPNGDGKNGGNALGGSGTGGGGGGGAGNNGTSGGNSSGHDGGPGGNNRFNFGGGSTTLPAGRESGGGKGGDRTEDNAGAGGAGEQMWTQTVAPIIAAGPGGGAGGGGSLGAGRAGGLYGGGGGGGGRQSQPGEGGQGIIVIMWRPA